MNGKNMEVNRKEVPLYGQVEADVKLQAEIPEDAEFYVVVQGSGLIHVTAAQRGGDGLTLSFTVPGHDLAEAVSVTLYCYSKDRVKPCEGETSLMYVRDVAQEAAEYLKANGDHLGPQSYQEVLRKCPAVVKAAGEEPSSGLYHPEHEVEPKPSSDDASDSAHLDEKITQALANMDYPRQWKNTDIQLGEGERFLTSPNQDGESPLQLAQRDGGHDMFRVLATPSEPETGPPPGIQCLWSDNSWMLRFCPRTNSVFLTVPHPQDTHEVSQEKLEEHGVQKLICVLRAHKEDKRERDDNHLKNEVFSKNLHEEELVLGDNVFEEQFVLSMDKDNNEEQNPLPSPANWHPMQSSGAQDQLTHHATASLPCTIHSSSPILVHQDELQGSGVDIKHRVSGATRTSTGTDGSLWDTEDLLATDTPPPYSEDVYPGSVSCSPLLSPVDQALTRLNRPQSSEQSSQRDSPPMETYDLSPSLVALEVDSEDESTEPKYPLSLLPSDFGKDEDKGESFCPTPELACTRSLSASACVPLLKELGEEGVRLRSYSYSAPKISFLPARFARDSNSSDIGNDAALHSVSHSRSLLQALSLSKSTLSLSLLHPGKQRAASISDQSHEKRIEEEELDKYHIPSKTESEKYKVIRTFSFLKNRMSSTRNKSKGKGKDREAKDRQLNGHRFATGSCLGPTLCVVCDKPASGKDLLHCSGCTAIVHKGCKDSVPPCLKKLQDKYSISIVKNRTSSLPQNFTVRDVPPQSSALPISTSLPVMTPKERKDTVTQSSSLSGSFPSSDSQLSEGSETESNVLKLGSQSEELLPTPVSSTSNYSSVGEDGVDSYTQSLSDISADSVDYEAESWSLSVEHKFCKKHDKRAVKRQDVIYELMQTELHHLQTLHIMGEVFRRGMRDEVQLDAESVQRVFPCLDQLSLFHHAFFAAMKERRHNSAQPHGHRNYLIQRIGDILVQQFSDENGDKMKQVYGEFCSHHNEAVGFFKELLQHNKRFQTFIKQQGNNYLVRRREIPECILLVTQRITKYPVLLERILEYTQEGTEEHADLSKALVQIKDVIAAVDQKVSEYERQQRLQEVWNRMENRTAAKLKNGRTFRKQDMMGPGQMLKHQGLLLWKTATGRLKDVLALLLTDTLILLQEKDQKYTFAVVDQKPPVIALQKLIVREVANEERGMFLISASSAGPEMYEVHTSSKEERNTWMRLIREAVESCPEDEEEHMSESEEEKRASEARFQKIQKLQESLMSQDQHICSSLEEKLQIYADISALSGRTGVSGDEPRLLIQVQSEELPLASGLLTAALKEAENLKETLSKARSPSSYSQDSDQDSVFAASPATLTEPSSDFSEASPETPEASEEGWVEDFVPQSPADPQKDDTDFKVSQSVQNLSQLLYSLQATVAIQDTCYEVQRLLLQERGRPSPRAQRQFFSTFRGNTLQEQEKQRNLEKRKEEVAAAQRLQDQLRHEKERWERECQARESQQGEQESRLKEREQRCQLTAEKLKQERDEFDEQLEEYQQSLERLREGQKSVERERTRLENQQKLFHSWKHGRQSSLPTVTPHMVIPLDGQQDPPPSQSIAHAGNGSVFVNEAAFASTSINNRHTHHKRNDPSAHNCLNTLLARSNSRQPAIVAAPHSQLADSQEWVMGTGYHCSPAGRLGLQHSASELGYNGETWTTTASGADPYLALPHHGDPQLDLSALVSLETDSDGEESKEETIVYL
ncbi:rho guanine nucleotide exchange factor 28 isoform 2-T2 [Menidia menidia]